MKLLIHIFQQPFIFATGLAALAHSTWALGTLFAGQEPPQGSLAWFAWLLPALLIAFSLDIGQIATSARIRAGQRTQGNYATFAALAGATYYLQFLYIAHHMPALQLGSGVSDFWRGFVTVARDAGIVIVPALLPLSTLLYTLSSQDEHQQTDAIPLSAVQAVQVNVNLPQPSTTQAQIEAGRANAELPNDVQRATNEFTVACKHCGQTFTKPNEDTAQRALRTHVALHCTAARLQEELVR